MTSRPFLLTAFAIAVGAGCSEIAAQDHGAPGPAPLPPPRVLQQPPDGPPAPAAAAKDDAPAPPPATDEPKGTRPIDDGAIRALAEEVARLRAQLAKLEEERRAAQEPDAPAAGPFTPAAPPAATAGQEPPATETDGAGAGTGGATAGESGGERVAERIVERVVEREVPVVIEVEQEVVIETEPVYVYEQVVYRDVSCHQWIPFGHVHSIGCGHHYYGCACHPWYYSIDGGFDIRFVWVDDDCDDDHRHRHGGHGHARGRDDRRGGHGHSSSVGFREGPRREAQGEPGRSRDGARPSGRGDGSSDAVRRGERETPPAAVAGSAGGTVSGESAGARRARGDFRGDGSVRERAPRAGTVPGADDPRTRDGRTGRAPAPPVAVNGTEAPTAPRRASFDGGAAPPVRTGRPETPGPGPRDDARRGDGRTRAADPSPALPRRADATPPARTRDPDPAPRFPVRRDDDPAPRVRRETEPTAPPRERGREVRPRNDPLPRVERRPEIPRIERRPEPPRVRQPSPPPQRRPDAPPRRRRNPGEEQ